MSSRERMTGRAWERLVLSKLDPFRVRVIVKYALLEQEPWKSRFKGHILSEEFEQEVDRICERYFGIKTTPGAIVYLEGRPGVSHG